MTEFTEERVKQAILDAGLEIYRAKDGRIQLAERVRLHLMDSGVAVDLQGDAAVYLTVRSQRSDFPTASADDLFAKVRERTREVARERGFEEIDASTRSLTDPVEKSHVLDIWHELTYRKPAGTLDGLLDDVRWALELPKCVDK